MEITPIFISHKMKKVPTDGWKMTQEINYLHLLAGLVRCQPCGTEMMATHDPNNEYVCVTLMLASADNCATPPIDAEYLDRLMVTRMVKNILTGKNLQAVIKGVQEKSGDIALQHQTEMKGINNRLAKQNQSRRKLMTAVEAGRTTFAKVAGRVQQLNDTKTRLDAQAMDAKKQMDIQDFMSDETSVRERVQNIDAYLREPNKEIVQEIIRTFIEEVLVGPATATLRYTLPMTPSGGPGKGAMTEEVALGQST